MAQGQAAPTLAKTNLTQLAHGAGFKLWVYKLADAIAIVNTANYFADAAPMLSVRDLMIVVDTNTPTTHFVTVLSCVCTFGYLDADGPRAMLDWEITKNSFDALYPFVFRRVLDLIEHGF